VTSAPSRVRLLVVGEALTPAGRVQLKGLRRGGDPVGDVISVESGGFYDGPASASGSGAPSLPALSAASESDGPEAEAAGSEPEPSEASDAARAGEGLGGVTLTERPGVLCVYG
jgi:hypothetical protein